MKPYRIRRATTRDIPTLTNQRHMMFTDMHLRSKKALRVHDGAFPSWARREILAGRLVCLLVEDSNRQVVGGGSLWLREVQPYAGFKGGKVPYLMSMYTDPRHRGEGVATALLMRVISWSRRRGYRSMTLHSSKMGRPLYKKLGWEPTSEMELDLSKVSKLSVGPARRRSRRSGR